MIPSFAGSPLPKRGGEAQERNARIILTYFRPWTLDGAWDEWVAAARSLRSKETWQLSLHSWLESGYALSSCRKYVSNFCAVNRVRPADDDLLENSDDNFEDEVGVLRVPARKAHQQRSDIQSRSMVVVFLRLLQICCWKPLRS